MKNIEILKKYHIDVDAALELWGDLESYDESLKEMKDSISTKLSNLEKFQNAMDWNNYAILAHSIKSELKYLGFMKEAEIFYEHELKGKENNGPFIQRNFPHLKETANQIIKLIQNYLEETKNLLIADDSDIILSFLEKNISKEYNILKASNGTEALALLENNHIYAILLDLNMPSLNGFEVLNYLKEHDLIEKIPIVIITGDDTKETIQKAFSFPILDVLNKPFDENKIKKILDSFSNFYHQDT